MGLFSGKKKTIVSSSVWNMAGDIADRADYLKSVVVGSVLLDTGATIGEAIPQAYLNGPGMGLRQYARWARGPSNYSANVGYVAGGISAGNSIDPAVILAQIPHASNEYVVLLQSEIGWADYMWWAEEYMVNNYPDLLFSNWEADVIDGSNNITIYFEDTTTVTFSPVDFVTSESYLYALYQVVSGGINGPITAGSVIVVPNEASFPSTAGYTLFSDVTTPMVGSVNVNTVIDVTYSDATPPEHTETDVAEPVSWDDREVIYHKFTLVNTSSSIRDLYVQNWTYSPVVQTPEVTVVNEDIGGGVIKTTTTTITREEMELTLSYHKDTQDVVNDTYSPYQYLRYKYGSGNAALDALFTPDADAGLFLPYIPVRIDNQNIKDFYPALYKQTRNAYRHAMSGGDLNKLVKKLNDNPQIGDLDFVYCVYGTSLNSPEQTARQYMFMFFSRIIQSNPDSLLDYNNWVAAWQAAEDSREAYQEWADNRTPTSTDVPPTVLPYPSIPEINLNTRSNTGWMNFWMNIKMNGIAYSTGSTPFPDKKKDEYWTVLMPSQSFTKTYTVSSRDGTVETATDTFTVDCVRFYHKISDSTWEAIDVYGLVHTNKVYDNKDVVTKAVDAMADPEESGFIIPLHEETYRAMRLVDGTQLATACCYLVFNCYQVVKQKWYQTGFFKILVVVVIIVVSIVFAPAGAGAAGVLGSSASVGAALGFSGTAAIVAGTVANAIAAMIITKALSSAFGDTFGGILGTIITVALTAYGGVMGGGTMDTSAFVTELTKADNLMAITNGLVKSVNSYMTEKTAEIMAETQRMMEQYKGEMLQVQKQYEEMFGSGRGIIDPMMFTDATSGDVGEPRAAYIERTLMCGSDVARMSQDLINRFATVTLDLHLPT
ncbi:MAG: hypothetical protein ACK5LG_21995 [Bacteroides thetaiotaomicron]